MIYYIDNVNGSDINDGLTEATAKKDYKALALVEGDCVLFKRGSIYRCALETVEGVAYSAWGEGEKPVFCGSVDASRDDCWEETETDLWKYTGNDIGKVGSIVFETPLQKKTGYGVFRWEKSELLCQGDFWDSRQIDENKPQEYDSHQLLLYSKGNPAQTYSHIEICHYGSRVLGYIKSGVGFDGLKFMNSGVHGIAGRGKNVLIRHCDFENIGGVMFYKERRIRFGNAIEFWNYGEDILIEGCSFDQVYDSCITHQGDRNNVIPARNMICRGNTFRRYGMAAFEYRDRMPINSSFCFNTCRDAGKGFSALGDVIPRRSEISPEPMGHHIFLWRMDSAVEGGSLLIANNMFLGRPAGAAIYSRISPEAEAQMKLCDNVYYAPTFIHYGGKDYHSLESFQAETNQDEDSMTTPIM